jgi:hypothetical protein
MENNDFAESYETSVENTNFSLIIGLVVLFVFNILLSGGGIEYFIQMLRTLQIIVHFPLFRLNFPASVMMMNSILMNVAMLDIFAHEKICSICNLSEYFEFNKTLVDKISSFMPSQMHDLGYETYISLSNTGSLSLFVIIYVAQVALVGVLYVFLKFTRCHESRIYQKVYESLLKGLFYD